MIQIFEISVINYSTTEDVSKWHLSIEHIANDEEGLKTICEIFILYLNDFFSTLVDFDVSSISSKYLYGEKQKMVFNYQDSVISLTKRNFNFCQN
jgi:hypothetical protein